MPTFQLPPVLTDGGQIVEVVVRHRVELDSHVGPEVVATIDPYDVADGVEPSARPAERDHEAVPRSEPDRFVEGDEQAAPAEVDASRTGEGSLGCGADHRFDIEDSSFVLAPLDHGRVRARGSSAANITSPD